MKTTQSQASKRLFKKLSALRATLSNEERAILDRLIVTEEVKAHKMTQKIASKAQTKADPKQVEVQAHKINSKLISKAQTKADPKADPKQVEVEGHKLNQKIASKAQPKTTPR